MYPILSLNSNQLKHIRIKFKEKSSKLLLIELEKTLLIYSFFYYFKVSIAINNKQPKNKIKQIKTNLTLKNI